MHGFTVQERSLLRALRTPQRIQDFIDSIPMNFEKEVETCLSPRRVLRDRRAHCMEGAMLAACSLRMAGYPPLVVDLRSIPDDDDHVVAVFMQDGFWGAISKTNHGVLRYREPIYKTIRELALSYFHEYTDSEGRKTLREYSVPVDLSVLDEKGWMTAEEDVWYVPEHVNNARHFPLLSRSQIARLRRADAMERRVGNIVEWQAGGQNID